MSKKNINSQQPPIIWDIVDQAFKDINDNFTELYLSIGGGGGIVDLTALSTNVSPGESSAYDLGSAAKRWRNLYLSGSSLYLGDAHVTATGTSVNLPIGSTIGGELIRNPAESSFRTVRISGQNDVVANDYAGVLTLIGNGITITTSQASDRITFTNTGVTDVTAGNSGISVSGTTIKNISNSGVLKNIGGAGITVSGDGKGDVTITNTGVTRLLSGSGIILSPLGGTGDVTVTNSSPNITQNLWRFISAAGQSTLDPISANSTLSFAVGNGLSVATSALNNSVTYTNTGVTSLASGTGISVSSSTGSVNLVNTGVTSLIAGDGISVSSSTGGVTVANTRFGFTSIAVSGQNPCLADNVTDTFTLVAGDGIILTTNATNDAVTITAPLSEYHKGNFVGFDSTLIINGTTSKVVGAIDTASLRTSELSIALGYLARSASDTNYSIGIGWQAAKTSQQGYAVAIGHQAGEATQGQASIAIGAQSGQVVQGGQSIAIGTTSGQNNQGVNAVAIGTTSGQNSQGNSSVAVGYNAGTNQGNQSVAIGENAGKFQRSTAVAIGQNAGGGIAYQNDDAVAIGHGAGENGQGTQAVAVGLYAGQASQGINAVAIGSYAGQSNQHANSIILNATATGLNSNGTNRFFVNPVRNTATNFVVHYNPVTKEVSYGEGLTVGSINVNSNLITTVDSNADLELAASGTGKVSILDQLSMKNAMFQGVMDLTGLASGDVVLTAADFTGNILTAQPLFTNRTLFIPNADASVAGLRLLIKNRSGTYSITIRDAALNVIDIVSASAKTNIACDGYTWFVS
jgi:hypothetical protein